MEANKNKALSADVIKNTKIMASELVKLFSECDPSDPMDAIIVSAISSFLGYFAEEVMNGDGNSSNVPAFIRSAALKMRDDFNGK